ncbi:MAG: HAD family hydrolase [Magnetovibrio sp.]|nr:HAD family hydrolase [Magnetovibrio sp.]
MLIIFDCDGVLVDSEPIAARVLARFLDDLGYPASVDGAGHHRFLGLTLGRVRDILEAETGRPLPGDFEDQLRERDRRAFEMELQAIPDVAEVLGALTAPRCVASSGPPAKIRNSLTLTNLLGHFEPHLFSAHDPGIANGKPAPDLFLHAARQMGARPAECAVVEDSRAGVEAGRAAGMRVLGFSGGGHCGPDHDRDLIDAGADAVFGAMTELPGLIKSA